MAMQYSFLEGTRPFYISNGVVTYGIPDSSETVEFFRDDLAWFTGENEDYESLRLGYVLGLCQGAEHELIWYKNSFFSVLNRNSGELIQMGFMPLAKGIPHYEPVGFLYSSMGKLLLAFYCYTTCTLYLASDLSSKAQITLPAFDMPKRVGPLDENAQFGAIQNPNHLMIFDGLTPIKVVKM